ncbi:MAG: nitroreductase family protein [Mycobacteriaceae bacterium]
MSTTVVDRETVHAVLALANRAPSVHNSQPWRWVVGADVVHLHADLHRWLPATDPSGRDLVVSCGAALHHLQVAAAAAGLSTRVHRIPDPDSADHLAAVELSRGPVNGDFQLAAAMEHRRSDRRPFATWPVPEQMLETLAAAAAARGAACRVVPDDGTRTVLLEAAATAAAVQDDTPATAAELARWSGLHASSDGVPAANALRHGATAAVDAGRRFHDGDLDPGNGGPDGATLLVIGSASDDPLSRLRAGEALSAVLLRATEEGLSTCPVTQALEVAESWRRVRDEVLGGTLCPQVGLRLGWLQGQEPVPASPRRPVAETVDDRR